MRLHRTTFARQAADLWALKERLWRVLLDRVAYDPSLSIVDSAPVPVCRFGRAWACSRFRGEAAYGYDAASKATIYGFRGHMRVCWPGVVTARQMAAANVHDLDLVPELVEGAPGQVLGDRNYWDPKLTAALAPAGIALDGPVQEARLRPRPGRAAGCWGGCAGASRRWPPVRGTVPPQTHLGPRRLAPDQPRAAQDPQPHRRRLPVPGARPLAPGLRPPRRLTP